MCSLCSRNFVGPFGYSHRNGRVSRAADCFNLLTLPFPDLHPLTLDCFYDSLISIARNTLRRQRKRERRSKRRGRTWTSKRLCLDICTASTTLKPTSPVRKPTMAHPDLQEEGDRDGRNFYWHFYCAASDAEAAET